MAKTKKKKPPKKPKWQFKNQWKAKYKTPEAMLKAVEKYFDDAEKITMCGLALALGFKNRSSLFDYKRKLEFEEIIAYACLRVEEAYEEILHDGKKCGGAIFALKNMGWTDSQSMELSGKDGGPLPPIEVTIIRGN